LENLLTTPEVAGRLGVAEITLRKWRISGSGPRFIRCGANVRYRTADIESWVSSRTVASTSEVA
jgi:predicted DNA-binding transcriptional regulator AlpA